MWRKESACRLVPAGASASPLHSVDKKGAHDARENDWPPHWFISKKRTVVRHSPKENLPAAMRLVTSATERSLSLPTMPAWNRPTLASGGTLLAGFVPVLVQDCTQRSSPVGALGAGTWSDLRNACTLSRSFGKSLKNRCAEALASPPCKATASSSVCARPSCR
jgi:hypothetical protein